MFEFLKCRGKVTTIEEAKKAYSNCECRKRKEEILSVWVNLYLPVVRKMIENGDVKALFDAILSPSDSGFPPIHSYGTPEGPIGEQIRNNLDKFLSAISTTDEAMFYHRKFCGTCCKNFYRDPIEKRWDQLSSVEVDVANTRPDIASAVKKAPYNSASFVKGVIKWVNSCQTVEELAEPSEYLRVNSPTYNSLASAVRTALYQRKIDMLFVEVPKVSDVKTIKMYYDFAPEGSAAKIFAFERWLSLCSTPGEANEAFAVAPKEAKICQLNAYNKAKDLAATLQS